MKNNTHISKKSNTFFSKISCCFQSVLFLFLITNYTVKAQVSEYAFSESLEPYTELTTPYSIAYAEPWDNHTNNNTHLADLGFTFNLDGTDFTQCYISPNGFITFGNTQPTATTYAPLSVATAYQGAVSALGIDLKSPELADNNVPIIDPYDIVYKTTGATGNRIFTVQWKNARRKADSGFFNFQIKLRENGDIIEIHYGACAPQGANNRTVQVGIRGANNAFNQGNVQNRMQNGTTGYNPWTLGNTISGTANNSTLRTSEITYPDLGLRYRYTPVSPCTTPTAAPTNLQIGATNITHNSFVGNSFTPASPAPTNYLVLRSLVNTPPNISEIQGIFWAVNNEINSTYTVVSVSNATTFNQTGLQPQTQYYYWVIPFNRNCKGAPAYYMANMLSSNAKTCMQPTSALAATNIEGNSFTANWNAVSGATDYRIDVATDNAFTNIVPGYNNLSVGNITSFNVTGLASLGSYRYRVRAIGNAGYCVINSNTITVNLPCGYYEIPYTQNFDSAPLLGLPPCFTRVNNNGDMIQWGVQTATYSSSPRSMFIAKNNTVDMDDWFFLPGLKLTGNVSYRLFFKYSTNSSGIYHENLRVRFGTEQNIAGMNETLLDLANIDNNSFNDIYVDFTPVTDGVYYIGYHGYSVADQSYIAIDDISITESPTCFEPTEIEINSVGVNTATISWVAASPPPSNGYQYYISTSATPPTGSTTPTGSVGAGITTANINGLNASTFYYIWVRGNCGASRSVWTEVETFSTECNPPIVTSSNGVTRCGIGTATISATPNSGSTINWYETPTGGIPIASGNNLLLPTLSTTTTYYAEAIAYGATALAGLKSPSESGGLIVNSTTNPLYYNNVSTIFNVLESTSLQSIDIFPIASGQSGQLTLRNASNIAIASFPFVTNVSGGNTPQTVMLNFQLYPGNYTLYVSNMPTSGLRMNTTGSIYPYTSSVANITGNNYISEDENDSPSNYFFFLYNWKFTTECKSPRVSVTATVTTPPAISISSSSEEICFGETSATVTISGHASYNTFMWSPATGVSGSPETGYTFNPDTTTTYTLTASQTSGAMCSNTVNITITVNPIPPAISIVPNTVIMCQDEIRSLAASVGSAELAVIFNEDFNAATNNWTVANTSIVGDTDASQWTLRQSVYNYSSQYWTKSFSSNDASQFYMANADAQGSIPNMLTRTTLTSPPINLSGYVSATLSFWHYLRYVSGDQMNIQISTDNGNTWGVLHTYLGSQGGPLDFVNATINLDSYVGNTLRIRFSFQSNWGYAWLIDNVQILAGLSLEVLWSPEDGLYEDEFATIPYTAGTAIGVVYAKPDATTTYTATALGTNGCSTSADVLIQVDEKPEGGILTTDIQILCGSQTPSDITLSGHTGNIIRWESADDSNFTLNVVNIPNTTNTLTAAQMGVIGVGRYFRAVIAYGVCDNVYSDVLLISYPVTIWDGTSWSSGEPDSSTKAIINLAGSYTFTTNIAACSLEIVSGNITVDNNATFLIENEVIVSGGSLTFESGTSLLQTYGSTADNVGAITYK
ncbi:MAG: choice-of-anchor J domain-containing protein, partial [Flavobacteriaceae bacterium]|nr:choice-of-anchor J domain-containing protein [Flavobacteriaceae bacterium]